MRISSLFSGCQGLGLAFAFASLLSGCTPGSGSSDETVGNAREALFGNDDFETGVAGAAPPSWTVASYLNAGITVQVPQSYAGLKLQAGGTARTNELRPTTPPATDADMGTNASLRYCRYGAGCALVNSRGSNQNVNSLSQTKPVLAGDVDPSDGQVHIRFVTAPVLQNPNHNAAEQPYYFVQLSNTTKSTILYTDFNLSAQAGVPWKTVTVMGNEFDYVDWTLNDIALDSSKVSVGDQLKLEIIAAGCSLGGHFGEVYVDGAGSTIPGLFVSGTGPAQANPGSLVLYDMKYKNGSSADATNVVITFPTPPNTTFKALTPPAGAVCVTPPVDTAGTITCTLSAAVPAGAVGTFQVSVALSSAATDPLVCGSYAIGSTQETPLIGAKIVTTVGCTADASCATGKWCDIGDKLCTPTLANSVSIPVDAPHSAPTLNGTCTAAAGALVCQSAVCDTGDNKCGKLNGSGPCSVATQATICRSGVCDAADTKCGYADNDGPCTAANAATVCRSGSCSANLLCKASAGCNVDADCTASQWCNESVHTCTAKLSNGSAIPVDAPHTSPTLNGNCSTAAGTVVCVAAVCDTDNKCGYADSDGPCTAGNAGTVCRSGICSSNLFCRSATGCNVDADCTGGKWCNEANHTCTAKLANGTGMPTDVPHTNPTLDGTCTLTAASLVCQAAVCDADNKCGKRNGSGTCTVANQATICRSGVCDADGSCGYATDHGPCSAANAATVCRSGSCSANLLCQPAGGCNVDGDCTGGQWCSIASHTCSAKLTNGSSIPTDTPHTSPTLNGSCTAPAATLVCQSSVCDSSDNRCGYAVNRGPCSSANAASVCRSGSCSSNLLCQPLNGCNVDADCTGGNWCNETLHACTPKLANNTAVPSDTPHANPALDGACTTAASALVCQSAVCDSADDKCGYDAGHGPCTAANGSVVCRSGECGSDGKCRPTGGCNLDTDCAPGKWCQQSSLSCQPKLANGSPMPTDAPHSSPTLDGSCTDPASALVCQSAVCDSADNLCGFANGHGPCTADNGAVVCRSASCSANGLCQPAAGCNVDADCARGKWCNVAMGACLPLLGNGTPLPSDAPHVSPTLDGTCGDAAASLVCVSGVCDTRDDECGFASGIGPCSAANAGSVCRSGRCATTGSAQGTCVNCTTDAHCSGDTPICNPSTGNCVECTSSKVCSGNSPICDLEHSICVKCDGDHGSSASTPCATDAAPFCFLSGPNQGSCGKCASDASCSGHVGNICDSGGGLCKSGCRIDTDCSSSEWCNDSEGMCSPKLANGTPLPGEPARVATCSTDAAAIICQSAVCDPLDGSCGLAPGDGPCADSDQCRLGGCNTDTKLCNSACTSDADCPTSEYCGSAGVCLELLPVGAECSSKNQCQTHDCSSKVCSGLIASGAGVVCATRPVGNSGSDYGAGLVLALIGAAASARRRRAKRPTPPKAA